MGMTMVMVTEKIMVMVMEMGIEEKEQAKTTATAMVMAMAMRRVMDGKHLSTCKAASASRRWPKSSIFTDTFKKPEINLDLKGARGGEELLHDSFEVPRLLCKTK